MIKLIASDLDKTLLNEAGELSCFTVDILRQCREKGILVVFVTARPERATRTIQVAFKPDAIISNNGATILYKDIVIYNNCIPAHILQDVIKEMLEEKDITCLSAEAGDCLFTNYKGPSWGEGWDPVYTDFKPFSKHAIPKLSVECKNAETLQRIILKYVDLQLFANSGESWYQIVYRGSTKSNALNRLIKQLELDSLNVVAFGDDYNDIDMLKLSGTGVAVANAIDELKLIADDVCDHHTSDGVAKWLKNKYSGLK